MEKYSAVKRERREKRKEKREKRKKGKESGTRNFLLKLLFFFPDSPRMWFDSHQ